MEGGKPQLDLVPQTEASEEVLNFLAADQDIPLTPEEEMLLQHSDVVLGPIREDVFKKDGGDGEEDGVQWHRTDLIGKQQPVAIVDLSFDDETELAAVFRPSYGNFRDYYQQYEAIRKHFPKLYMSTAVPSWSSGTHDLLVIEKIEGYHGDYQIKPTVDEFRALVSTPEGLEQLCQDTFEAADEILAEPLQFSDVDPPVGHNVVYNTATNRFQFFDIDTLHPSERPHVQKFLEWFISPVYIRDPMDKGIETKIAYVARMIQLYEAAHPDTDLSYESDPKEVANYSITDEVYPTSGTLLYPGTKEYDNAYSQLIGRGLDSRTLAWNADYPVFKKIVKTGKDVTTIDPDMLEAIHKGDVVQLRELFETKKNSPSRGKVTTTRFVEAA